MRRPKPTTARTGFHLELLALSLYIASSCPIYGATGGSIDGNPESAPVAPAEPNLIDNLNRAINAYKPAPDPQSWQNVFNSFSQLVANADAKHIDLSAIDKTLSTQLGMRLYEGNGIRVWSFPKVPEAQHFLLQSHDVTTTTVPNPRRRRAPIVTTRTISKLQVLTGQPGLAVSEAKIVQPGKALVILGFDSKTGSAWVQGYKLADKWQPAPELFSAVPPFLFQSMQGKVTFNGANIILTISSAKSTNLEPGSTASGGYKINLTLNGDHYAMDSRAGADPATAVAMQFMQAIGQGKVDLVKAWLADPKLSSIPEYLKLYNKGDVFRLVPMAPPPNAVARFRIVTFERDDLVFDVAKLKQQLGVRALFIAPPDPLAKKLLSTAPPVMPKDSRITPDSP